jgi:hypothetical protein
MNSGFLDRKKVPEFYSREKNSGSKLPVKGLKGPLHTFQLGIQSGGVASVQNHKDFLGKLGAGYKNQPTKDNSGTYGKRGS